MAGIRQWDTDWIDQFKKIFTTSLSNLQLYPSNPLAWLNTVDIPFGQKQVQRGIRVPDQNVNVSKNIEYIDKYARRDVQVVDMNAITDSLRIDEEYYAGDTVNAIGHVGDISQNFLDAITNYAIVGTAVSPLSYGLIDTGPTTGSTTLARPDPCDDVSTNGLWVGSTAYINMMRDLGEMEVEMIGKGFFSKKILCTHPLMKPFLNITLTNTLGTMGGWVESTAGYPIVFHPQFDLDATVDAVDVYMVTPDMHDLYMTPIKARGFFDNNTEDFVWHWQTRAYLLARPLHDGTDWNKGIVKCTVDLLS